VPDTHGHVLASRVDDQQTDATVRTADEDGVMIEPLKLEHCQRSLEMLVAGSVRSEQVDELKWRLRLRRSCGHAYERDGRTDRRRDELCLGG
jgi:hypothetical protein